MTSQAIAQAAIIALTMQNMNNRAAPLSTETHTATVIDHNISIGETVGLYYHTGESLLRIGDMPSYQGDFWADEDNRFYTVIDNKLVVKDGLDGEVKDASIDAYDFVVAGDNSCCAYKTSSTEDQWCVIFPDGSITMAFIIPSSGNNGNPKFGYRNGILGVCKGSTGSWSGTTSYTYTNRGELIQILSNHRTLAATEPLVLPINEKAITYAEDSLGAYLNNRITRVYYSTPFDSIGKSPWEGYDVSNPNSTNQWLGADQSYIYVRANTYEGDVYTGSPIGRVPIGSYAVEIIRIEGDDISYGVGDGAGTAVVQYTSGGNVVCQLFDLRTMHTVYTDVELSLSTRTKIRQNDGYIWIDGNGVYQKLPNGWLMYPTSVYDKYDLSRIYGYAIRNTKVGREGKAIILFE